MKNKIIVIIVWVLLTLAYCWNFSDVGKSIGKKTNSAIESYSDMVTEYGGTDVKLEDSGKAISDMYSYKTYNNLGGRFSGQFLFLSITTAIYIISTICCCYFGFIKK